MSAKILVQSGDTMSLKKAWMLELELKVLSQVDASVCVAERVSIFQRSHVDTATLWGYELQH